MLSKLLRYYNTIKYLKPIQVYGRIFSRIKKYFPSNLPHPPSLLTPSLKPKTNFIFHDFRNTKDDLKRNKFCFLNHSIDFGGKINWKPDADMLWQFNLHYFNYLFLFSEEDKIKICTGWISSNPQGEEPGWHPYPLSLRITNWCKANLQNKLINESLYSQAAFLYRNLEYYHPANHYLENARALIFAGNYFLNQGEAKKWLEKGIRIIAAELPKQVFPDGGYFEKSPMYHALMMELVLDLLNILPADTGIYPLLQKASGKMIDFLNNLTHPDGNIALFNDSTEEIASPTKELNDYFLRLNLSEQSKIPEPKDKFIQAYTDSGFYIFRNEDIYLAVDGGSIGPDFIPAHAHADIFSYELSVNGEKIVVDSGVYEYKTGELRNYARSTKAHNTVTIDGKNQAEVWGSFRAARRYPPKNVRFEELDNKIIFSGEFSGYSKLIGSNLNHKRNITFSEEEHLLAVEDKVEGAGKHFAETCIHLHPSVKIENADKDLILQKGGIKIKLFLYDAPFRIEDGFYFPEFGKKIINKVVVISSEKMPASMKYAFQF